MMFKVLYRKKVPPGFIRIQDPVSKLEVDLPHVQPAMQASLYIDHQPSGRRVSYAGRITSQEDAHHFVFWCYDDFFAYKVPLDVQMRAQDQAVALSAAFAEYVDKKHQDAYKVGSEILKRRLDRIAEALLLDGDA